MLRKSYEILVQDVFNFPRVYKFLTWGNWLIATMDRFGLKIQAFDVDLCQCKMSGFYKTLYCHEMKTFKYSYCVSGTFRLEKDIHLPNQNNHCPSVFWNKKDAHRNGTFCCFFTFSWNIVFISCISRLLPLPLSFSPFFSLGVTCFCWELF